MERGAHFLSPSPMCTNISEQGPSSRDDQHAGLNPISAHLARLTARQIFGNEACYFLSSSGPGILRNGSDLMTQNYYPYLEKRVGIGWPVCVCIHGANTRVPISA